MNLASVRLLIGLLVGCLIDWLVVWLVSYLVTNVSETSSVVLSNSSGTIPEHSPKYITSTPCLIAPVLNLCFLLNSFPPFLTETTSSVRGRASLIVYVSCLTMLVTSTGRPSERKCRRVTPLKIPIHTSLTCHVSRTAKIKLHALRLKDPKRSLT